MNTKLEQTFMIWAVILYFGVACLLKDVLIFGYSLGGIIACTPGALIIGVFVIYHLYKLLFKAFVDHIKEVREEKRKRERERDYRCLR